MIKFFRRIRQQLVSQNKFSKYMLYAIGEIVLVVIGILIALQINNTNEKRKARIQEITILENIQEDINLDTLDLAYNIHFHNLILKGEKDLLRFLQSNQDTPSDSLNYNDALGNPAIVVLHKSTYNNVQNNSIGLITNNKLHKEISRFYDFFNEVLLLIENKTPLFEPYGEKLFYFKKYFQLTSPDSNKYNLKNEEIEKNIDYFNPIFEKQNIEFVNISGAKNDEAFKFQLNESIYFRQLKLAIYVEIINRIKELNALINNELNVLRN